MSDPVEKVTAMIQRATEEAALSKQPRFDNPSVAWSGLLPLLMPTFLAEREPPPYLPDSRTRDQWLRRAWRQEPHLAGVVNSVVLIDANRGWTLTGGRNQVLRYLDVLHSAEAGQGWRPFCRKASLSFWEADMGALIETGRDARGGPLRALFHLDSARCRFSANTDYPLEYFPAAGGQQLWEPGDYFRVASLPSADEAYRGLGLCAVSRCIEVARILYAVLVHDQEQLTARAPKGLLLLSGISEQQWEDSLQAREAKLDSLERRYYAGVQVLASSGIDNIDAKLIALSQLPANFDAKIFTDLCMYTYALAFGYDPSEFWPVQFGALGRGNESAVQHQKATGKGGLDFALTMQEQMQAELPETLAFEFEQRDDAGEMTIAAVQQAKLGVIKAAYESGLSQGAPLISQDEGRQMLAEAGLIPEEWTAAEEDVEVSDTEDVSRAMAQVPVQRALQCYPTEQIVRVQWPGRRLHVIYTPGEGWGRRRWRTFARPAMRREAPEDSGVLYQDEEVTITEEDVLRAVRKGGERVGAEFVALLTAPTRALDEGA